MKIKGYLLILILLTTIKTSFAQIDNRLSEQDSILVLKKIYTYNFENRKFNDIDEMYLEDLWIDNKESALILFDKAIRLSIAPIHERMIIASYLYKNNKPDYVTMILNDCNSSSDTIAIFKIMDSYKIKFSDFNIDEKQLHKYCKKCNYK